MRIIYTTYDIAQATALRDFDFSAAESEVSPLHSEDMETRAIDIQYVLLTL